MRGQPVEPHQSGDEGRVARSTLSVTPHGKLDLVPDQDAPELDAARATALAAAFAHGNGHGLLELGARAVAAPLPPVFAWWRSFAARFVTSACSRAEVVEASGRWSAPDAPAEEELETLCWTAPMMLGAEYLTGSVLRAAWDELARAFESELAESGVALAEFLRRLDPAWNVVGRVHFNLAENRRDAEAPFAFLATYTGKLGANGRPQHQPLGQALKEYAGAANKPKLLSLLVPVQRAAEQCAWLRTLVEKGELFHPLRWSPREAFELLGDAAVLEHAGVVVRMPASWSSGRPPRPRAAGTVGARAAAGVGQAQLLDFRAQLVLDGEPLTEAEVKELLAGASGLRLLRGQWVEVDRERLAHALERLRAAEELARSGELDFAAAMRLLSGAEIGAEAGAELDRDWSRVQAGPWLAERLAGLRSPDGLKRVHPGAALKGTLRPYQEAGVRWLHVCAELGLGACLADDMGLGKTVQVLALLLVRRAQRAPGSSARPSLLVAPASLLANWKSELERFTPSLKARIAHPSALPPGAKVELAPAELAATDLVITTYGTLLRQPWLKTAEWDLVVLDEAQAIKNPGSKQTRAVKELRARARIALTGTPIENRLTDLWSLFDFLSPGLLGTAKEFARYEKRLADGGPEAHGPLRELVRPYILRRMKTDKTVIADLPEKTELRAWCALSRRQAALYQASVDELAQRIAVTEGIQRRGLVLAFLMRFKQICNHPSHGLADGAWDAAESGKFARLGELGEVIAAKQEKLLVFTQFREATEPLAAFLGGVFGRAGLVLHGDTPVKTRQGLVKRFQEDERVPFFVLSLKAGGTGLNLTAASHVVHFDRWWNPAVEDQATDRAFRIGQKRNVLVHKFVCRGTVEERIDDLITSKKALAQGVLQGGKEVDLTALDDKELMRMVALDLSAVRED
ncbi:MAG: DEAD/DEAH box helicase [Planctomycetes bacterium]|nr:DEAD/DEAH box helicase [Planctomycetota bacterium]